MEQNQITEIVGKVIRVAAKTKGWSLATLTRRVGKGQNTLHRWQTGATTSYDLVTLTKLFKMAGWSMDDALGITRDNMSQSAPTASGFESLRSEVGELKKDMQLLKPLAVLLNTIAGAAAELNSTTQQGDEQSPAPSHSAFDHSALRKGIADAKTLGEQIVSDESQDEQLRKAEKESREA